MRTINKIFIHHTGHGPGLANEDITREMIKRWHVEGNGWDDIGYNRVILWDARVVMGRDDALIPAHCKGQNAHSLGICVVGNFDRESVPKPVWDALVWTCAELCKRYDVSPEQIYGHKDYYPTECPGKNMIRRLPELRQKVRKYL